MPINGAVSENVWYLAILSVGAFLPLWVVIDRCLAVLQSIEATLKSVETLLIAMRKAL